MKMIVEILGVKAMTDRLDEVRSALSSMSRLEFEEEVRQALKEHLKFRVRDRVSGVVDANA